MRILYQLSRGSVIDLIRVEGNEIPEDAQLIGAIVQNRGAVLEILVELGDAVAAVRSSDDGGQAHSQQQGSNGASGDEGEAAGGPAA